MHEVGDLDYRDQVRFLIHSYVYGMCIRTMPSSLLLPGRKFPCYCTRMAHGYTFEFLFVRYRRERDITVPSSVHTYIWPCTSSMHTYRVCNLWSHGDKSMRSFHIRVLYTHSTLRDCVHVRLYLQFVCARVRIHMHDWPMYWQNVWKWVYVCARAHMCIYTYIHTYYMYICMYVCMYVRGCRRILLYWSRVVDHLPFSSPTLPHLSLPLPTSYRTAPLHPMLTSPFLCASSSCSTPRHPSENLRLSSHTYFPVLAHLRWYTSCHKYVSEFPHFYVHRHLCFPVYRCLLLIAAIEFFVSLRRAHVLKWIMYFTWYRHENGLFGVKYTRKRFVDECRFYRIDISSG